MFKIFRLVRVQLGTVMVDMLSIGNTRKRNPKSIYAGLALFTLVLGSVAFFYSYMIGKGLQMYDSIEVLPALMMAVTSMIVLLTTMFKIKGTVFGFKDYDILMSLPVRTGAVVASRLLLLYAMNMIFVCIVMIPMMIAYGMLAKPGILFYILGLVMVLTLPLVPIVIASVFGTIIAYAASRFRYSNLVSIVVSLGFLLAIMGVSFTMKDTGQELVNLSKALTDQVNSIYPLAGMYTRTVVSYDMASFLAFLGISLLGFLLYAAIVGKIFKKMNTMIMTGRSRRNFKMGELKQASPLKALFRKEIRRYFSSPLYVLNTAFGIVLLTIGAIALFFVDINKLTGQMQAAFLLNKSVPCFISFCIATCCTTHSSISLEGKSFWIIKSLPVTPKTIFLSKLAVNLAVAAPALIDAVLIGIALKIGVLQTFFALVFTVIIAVFVSLLGLLVNLEFPNFNWVTETVVIKQSAAAMISIFTGLAAVGLLIIFLVLIPSTILTYLVYMAVMIVISFILYRILMSWGIRQFNKLY